MSSFVLDLVATYGAPALCVALLVSAVGVPLPGTVLLLMAGALISTGDLDIWQVLIFGTIGAVAGDQVGYWIGRASSTWVKDELTRLLDADVHIERAETMLGRWGWIAVFLTRWLITPLGPWVNVGSGSIEYSWAWFVAWGTLGEALWVGIYVTAGALFADRVQAVGDLVSSSGWVLAGLTLAVLIGWQLVQRARRNGATPPGS
ncbi:MAG: DedA family protein [Dehalococcoidia bacterium]